MSQWMHKALCDSSTFFRFLLNFQSSADNVSPCYYPNLQEWKFHYVYKQKCSMFCERHWGKANEQELQRRVDQLTSFPVLSSTGNLRYLVSSSNRVAASRLVFSRTARGEDVITSAMTLPLVLLNSLCISRNVCRAGIMSSKNISWIDDHKFIHKSSENKWDK